MNPIANIAGVAMAVEKGMIGLGRREVPGGYVDPVGCRYSQIFVCQVQIGRGETIWRIGSVRPVNELVDEV